jgi:Protein of unknown function (DUF2384)
MGEAMSQATNDLLDGEKVNIYEELQDIVKDPDRWLDQPNDQLGGKPPRDFLGSPEKEKPLRDLLRAIKHGMPT